MFTQILFIGVSEQPREKNSFLTDNGDFLQQTPTLMTLTVQSKLKASPLQQSNFSNNFFFLNIPQLHVLPTPILADNQVYYLLFEKGCNVETKTNRGKKNLRANILYRGKTFGEKTGQSRENILQSMK